MQELKVGNLMIDLVVKHYGKEGGLYQNVRALGYATDEIIGMSKELSNNDKLFSYLMNCSNSSEVELKNSDVEEIFKIVDKFTRKNTSNYIYIKDLSQYRLLTDSKTTEYLGKKCWYSVYECDNFDQIRDNISDDNKEFFKLIGESLKEPKKTMYDLEGYLDETIDYLSESSYERIWNAVEVAIKTHFPRYTMNFYSEWVPKELSDKDLGQMAWNFVKETITYTDISDSDKEEICKLGELIWDNISNDDKDSIKEYLLNEDKKQCKSSKVTSSTIKSTLQDSIVKYLNYCKTYKVIESSVNKVLNDNFNSYFYVKDKYWVELIELGEMAYYMIGKYDPMFKSIGNEIEDKNVYTSCMLSLAKHIKNKSKVYTELKNLFRYSDKKDYLNWTLEQYMEKFTYSKDFDSKKDSYKEVIFALNDTVKELISDRVVWNNTDFVWNSVENQEDDTESLSLNINIESKFKVSEVTVDENGNKVFKISCIMPYLSYDGEGLKFTKELYYKYDFNDKKYTLLNDDICHFIGITFEDVYEAVSKLCKKHIRLAENR